MNFPRNSFTATILLVLALAGSSVGATQTSTTDLPIERESTPVADVSRGVMLSVARAGTKLIAVGERGMVLLSEDKGFTWHQVTVPTSVTLTAVKFVTPDIGWAVGHYGVVLATRDGGLTWRKQMNGMQAAALVQKAALASHVPKAVTEAARLIADGPDKPFLDLHFVDERHGYVVGAYNLIFETTDAGETWQPRLDALVNPKGNHLYGITGAGRTLYIAGEQGVLFRSNDGGASFTRLTTPYAGSWFALALLKDGSVVAGGLRGNTYRSSDQGTTWQKVQGLPNVLVVSLTVAADDTLWLGNQAGQIFKSRDGGETFVAVVMAPNMPPPPLTQLLPFDQSLVLSSLRGMRRIPLNEPR